MQLLHVAAQLSVLSGLCELFLAFLHDESLRQDFWVFFFNVMTLNYVCAIEKVTFLN